MGMNEVGKTQAAPGYGSVRSPVVIVGQSLCGPCMKMQEPFYGGSGRYLNEALRRARRTKKQIYITNVVHCRPPNNRKSKQRGRPAKRYRVGWHEIARDADGQPIPRYPNRSDSPPKLVRRQETYDTREAAQSRVDEINPKIVRGQSAAAQRAAGSRTLSHYAQAWLDGLAGQVKPRVLRRGSRSGPTEGRQRQLEAVLVYRQCRG